MCACVQGVGRVGVWRKGACWCELLFIQATKHNEHVDGIRWCPNHGGFLRCIAQLLRDGGCDGVFHGRPAWAT
jgi:hypothetical protein